MRRRVRAIAFGGAALLCAGLAAAMTGGYRQDIQSELGPLRPVVVATARIPAGHPIAAKEVENLLEVRRIPERFAPVGALATREQAAGRAPATAIPAGSYVLVGQLREPNRGDDHDRPARLGPGRKPVEISVTGAEALGAGRADPIGARVDVIVTTEPGPGGGHGRTYVAASGVRLLDAGAIGRRRWLGLLGVDIELVDCDARPHEARRRFGSSRRRTSRAACG